MIKIFHHLAPLQVGVDVDEELDELDDQGGNKLFCTFVKTYIMAFVVKFTVTQSVDGDVISVTDITNYGDGGSFNKVDMSSRTLYITRGDSLQEQVIPFPFTNTTNSIQDVYQFSQDKDYAYSIKMILVDNNAIEYEYVLTVITTEYHNQQLRELLSDVDGCGCHSDCRLIQKIQCALDAATARACAADIAGAQRLLDYASELYENHNC